MLRGADGQQRGYHPAEGCRPVEMPSNVTQPDRHRRSARDIRRVPGTSRSGVECYWHASGVKTMSSRKLPTEMLLAVLTAWKANRVVV